MEVGLDQIQARSPLAFPVPKSHTVAGSPLLEIQCRTDNQASVATAMYISAWPSLNLTHFMERRTSRTIPFPLGCSTSTYFYVARNGIYHLMQSLGSRDRGVVLVPDYHHGNEIYAMKAAGVKLRYYPVRKNLNVDLDAVADLCNFEPKPFALYVTHFIGWPQPMNEIQGLCREKNLTLIEDCALSFMSTFEGKP